MKRAGVRRFLEYLKLTETSRSCDLNLSERQHNNKLIININNIFNTFCLFDKLVLKN
jgi:hypothetical protein